jgi:transcriptional regulator with XRE-family HTH domain
MSQIKRKKKGAEHYRHAEFQKALGDHCRKLRTQKGYSVNRLAREAERLSPDAIIRLESGGVVTTVTLYRFADVLGIPVKKLFDFHFTDSGIAE